MRRPRRAAFAGLVALATTGCDEPKASEPCAPVSTDCAPLYEPTFDQIHARTLVTSCALGGGACHGPSGGQGGVRLADADEAYRTLVTGGKVGTAQCSELWLRMTSTDGDVRMPPGRSLPEAERCSIAKWIASGAKR